MIRALILFFTFFSFQVLAENQKIQILTTLPEYAEMAAAIGGERLEVQSLLKGEEDAHFLDPKPSFLVRAMKADLVIRNGLELEDTWWHGVASGTGRAEIQKDGKRDCNLGSEVEALEKPSGPVDRSMGHVHSSGNPHYNLSPRSLIEAGRALTNCLNRLFPEKKENWEKGFKRFDLQMKSLQVEIQELWKNGLAQKGRKKGLIIYEYHREFAYWARDLGLQIQGQIEEKPGLAPSALRVAQLGKQLKSEKVDLILAGAHHPLRHLLKIKEETGIPFVKLPVMAAENRSIAATQKLIVNQVLNELTNSNP